MSLSRINWCVRSWSPAMALAVLALVAGPGMTAQAQTLTVDIGSGKIGGDAVAGGNLASQWIRADSDVEIKGPEVIFIGELPSGADLRGIAAFDLSSFHPGITVSNAEVSLFHGENDIWDSQDGTITSSTIEMSLVTSPDYANNGASWNNANQAAGTPWSTPGGDFGPTLVTVSGLDLTTIDTSNEVTFASSALTSAIQDAIAAGDSQITLFLRSPDLEASNTRNFFIFDGGLPGHTAGMDIGPNLRITYVDEGEMLTDMQEVSGSVAITWDALVGRSYRVEATSDLNQPGDWPLVLATNYPSLAGAEATSLSWTGMPATAMAAYRVAREPPPPPGLDCMFFEGWEDGGAPGWTTALDYGSEPSWDIGVPVNGPGEAAYGTNVAATSLTGNYGHDTIEYLLSPPIDLTDAGSAELSFDHWYEVEESYDFIRLSIVDATTELPVVDGESILNPPDGLNGASGGLSYQEAVLSLPADAFGRQIKLRFEIHAEDFPGTEFPGWYLDNICVKTGPLFGDFALTDSSMQRVRLNIETEGTNVCGLTDTVVNTELFAGPIRADQIARTFLEFDLHQLAAAHAPGAVASAVSLDLFNASGGAGDFADDTTNSTVNVHLATKPFVIGEITEAEYAIGSYWDTCGGDFVRPPLTSLTLDHGDFAAGPAGTLYAFPGSAELTAAAQAAIDGDGMLRLVVKVSDLGPPGGTGEEEDEPAPPSGLIRLFRFGSPQSAAARPTLNITIDPSM